MSKKSVRKEHIGFWFNQLKNGVSTSEGIHANIEYSGYFLYKKEVEDLLASQEELTAIGVTADDVELFGQFLVDFDLIKTPKYSREAKGDGGSRTQLNTVEGAKEKGVADENIPSYLDAINAIYSAKKVAETFLNGKKIAISIPDRNKAAEGSPAPEVAENVSL